jgi:hypothetical protein
MVEQIRTGDNPNDYSQAQPLSATPAAPPIDSREPRTPPVNVTTS